MLKVQCKNLCFSGTQISSLPKNQGSRNSHFGGRRFVPQRLFSLRPLHLILHFRSTYSQLWGNIVLALHICARKTFQTLTKICQEVWLIIQQTLLARGTLLQRVRNFQGRCIQVEAISPFYWSVQLGVILTRMKPPKNTTSVLCLLQCSWMQISFWIYSEILAKGPVASTKTRYNLS